jgi:catechol 2,3-dioxygenase-like lactoylglutathione lyase family enzyme
MVLDHVDIRVADREASERFYTSLFDAIGKDVLVSNAEIADWGDFSVLADGQPVARNLHIAFWVPTTELVDRFHAAGGLLRDPDGNIVEAVTGPESDRVPGAIDHIWLRSPDLQAAKLFYETIGPFVDVRLGDDEPDRVRFITQGASLTFVTNGEATENVHIAFAAPTNEQVDAFHKAATDAGYTDNGAPGERAAYHPGYYGAFVLDPDGHNIEAVNHNR